MRRAGLVAALLLSGCFNFDDAAEACRSTGRCEAGDGGAAVDGGLDAGSADAGTADAGVSDGGASLAPVAWTATGFAWEYPYPAGPGLFAVAPVDDDELYAIGDDDLLLHYARGRWTSAHLPAPDAPAQAVCLLHLADGGLFAFDSTSTSYVSRADGGFSAITESSSDFLGATACALGSDGRPWVGGQRHADSISAVGPGIQEGPGAMRDVWFDPQTPSTAAYVVALDPSGVALTSDNRVVGRQSDGGWTTAVMLDGGYFPKGGILRVDPSTAWVCGWNGGSFTVPLDGGPGAELSLSDPNPTATHLWTSMVSEGPDVLVGGGPGVARCQGADPGSCSLEYADPLLSVTQLARGVTATFAVGQNGQVLRHQGGAWQALAPGARPFVSSVWLDQDGTLWAGAQDGWVLHRTASGWVERQVPNAGSILGLTRTSDGTLWAVGEALFASLDDQGGVSSASIQRPDGGAFTVEPGSGQTVSAISGSTPGNTWAVGGYGFLAGWDDANGWRQVPLPSNVHLASVWTSDAGTAWATGGYQTRKVYFFDGTSWSDVTPASPGSGDLTDVWGAGPREAFVTGQDNAGFHYLADGGVKPWSLGNDALTVSSFTGLVRADGGISLWGIRGDALSYAPTATSNGLTTPLSTGLGYANVIRALGGTIYVAGPRYDGHSGFVISLDAGR
jgi:hypothetical protein